MQEIQELLEINNLDVACERFGDILGLDRPTTEKVLLAALENEEYANNLLISRRDARYLSKLLQNPPDLTVEGKKKIEQSPANLQLLKNVTKAMAKWSITGFSTVDKNTEQQRLASCEGCEFLSKEAPNKLIYKALGQDDKRVCTSCGCPIVKKIRMSSESCPEKNPQNPGFNRWGEHMVIKNTK